MWITPNKREQDGFLAPKAFRRLFLDADKTKVRVKIVSVDCKSNLLWRPILEQSMPRFVVALDEFRDVSRFCLSTQRARFTMMRGCVAFALATRLFASFFVLVVEEWVDCALITAAHNSSSACCVAFSQVSLHDGLDASLCTPLGKYSTKRKNRNLKGKLRFNLYKFLATSVFNKCCCSSA